MHKVWSMLGEVPYCISSSSVKFQGHTEQKIVYFDPNWALPDCSSLNLIMAMKWCTKLEVGLEGCLIVFQGHLSNFKVTWLKTIVDFESNWAFPDCNSSLNSPMSMKWCKKLEVAQKMCPIVFQCHLSNFKVTWDRKSPILTRIVRFQTVTPVWIHRWLWNDAQCLM